MSHITPAELIEIVPYLRTMAAAETSAAVRAALLRLADRYAAPDFAAEFASMGTDATPLRSLGAASA